LEAYKLGKVPWRLRGGAAGYYAGLAPFALLMRRPGRDPFLEQHLRQALATWAMLVAWLLLFIVGVLALTYAMTWHRSFYETYHLEGHLLNATRKLFLCWCVFWVFGCGLALMGSRRELPLVWRLAARPRLRQVTAVILLLVYAAGLVTGGLVWRAKQLLRDDAAPARAYCLYHDNGVIPQWIFALGFYRIASAAQAHWGDGATIMLPLSRESLERALAEGTFIFLGSHGVRSGLLMDKGFLKPEDVAVLPKSPDLALVYLAGCDSGASRDGWTQALAPAEVVTFDRLTSVLEHSVWLWMTGPNRISGLPK
jgi:hypothetical protein